MLVYNNLSTTEIYQGHEVESLTTNTTPAKIRPSRWFYVIGIIVLIGGPAVSSAILFSTIFSSIDSMAAEIPSTQVVVPSSSDITLSQPGKYTVFYEYQTMVGNRIYSTGENIPGIQVNLVSKESGDEILLSSASVNRTYTIGSRSGIGLFDFVIDQPGAYELSASYPAVQGQQQEQSPEIVLAVIHSSAVEKLFGSIMGTIAGALAIVFIPFVVGVAIIIITFIKRRKASARARATA